MVAITSIPRKDLLVAAGTLALCRLIQGCRNLRKEVNGMCTLDGKIYISLKKVKLEPQKARFRRGQTLVEYALILAFISIVAVSVLATLGKNVSSVYSMVDSQVSRGVTGS